METLTEIVRTDRRSAVAAWGLTLVLALAAAASARTGAYLWAGLVVVIVAVVVLPPVADRDWTATVPWPHLLAVTVAVVVRASGAYRELAGYVAVASLAVLVVVELDAFTPVEMTRRFAVLFGVLTTMAIQGWWAVGQFYSDRWFGTDFITTQTELQWDFVVVSAVAVALGVLSEVYLATAAGDADEPTSLRTSNEPR